MGLPYLFLLQKMCIHVFPPMFERGLGRVTKWHVCGRGKKAFKKNRFYGIYIEISQ